MKALASLFTLAVAASAHAAEINPDLMQSAHRFEATLSHQVSLDYLLHLPEGYDAAKKRRWPLILFLHGAGERGDDLNLVAVHGPPKLVSKQPRARKGETAEQKAARLEAIDLLKKNFIVVSPQCAKGDHWHANELSALLDRIEKEHRVDANRIYLTGLSMGGYGSWELGVRHHERFAAIAPICGGGDPDSVAFCHEIGLDYVSCSPFRVPIARLAAAQAALN